MNPLRQVLVLVNPKSGRGAPFGALRRSLDECWDLPGSDVWYQFSRSREDGAAKARRAVERGVDLVLAVGGDGTVNTVGRVLLGTGVALGVVPAGSGNGFARHFGIPLTPGKAVRALAGGTVRRIDVGVVEGHPFLVTCSMAWDAALVRSFDKSPVRGIVPYVFAGVNEFFRYGIQEMRVELDGAETMVCPDPLLFTVANLTQFGGGARIAPDARADDGWLELVVALRQDAPKLIANIGRLFDGSINRLPEVMSRRFRTLVVRRERPAPIQVDGELVDAPADLHVEVRPGALAVLVPGPG